MSLTYALAAAVNGTTGLRAILLYGLVRTKLRRRRSGQHPGFSRRTGGRASGQEHSYVKFEVLRVQSSRRQECADRQPVGC